METQFQILTGDALMPILYAVLGVIAVLIFIAPLICGKKGN